MTGQNPVINKGNSHVWLVWVARILGTVAALFFLLFFIGEGLLGAKNLINSGFQEISLRIATGISMLLICSVALLLAWRWERLGGWVAILAMAVFALVYPKGFPLWFFAALAASGVLHLFADKFGGSARKSS